MSRTKRLRTDDGIRAALSCYGPGERMDDHAHDDLQLSFILSGHLIERSAEGNYMLPSGSMLVKPDRFEHADEIGANGCLILTLSFFDAIPKMDYMLNTGGMPSNLRQRIWRAAQGFAFGACGRKGALEGLPTLRGVCAPAAQNFEETVAVSGNTDAMSKELAARAGYHPVHFARVFRARNGLSPRAFRKSEQAAAAMQDIVFDRVRLADVAYKHGFSDQAHMSRTIKSLSGLTPRHLRQVFAAA